MKSAIRFLTPDKGVRLDWEKVEFLDKIEKLWTKMSCGSALEGKVVL